MYSMSYSYAVTGNPFDYPETAEDQALILEENEKGLITAAIQDW